MTALDTILDGWAEAYVQAELQTKSRVIEQSEKRAARAIAKVEIKDLVLKTLSDSKEMMAPLMSFEQAINEL